MADFIPRRDRDLVTWTGNFALKIAADPASLGLTEAQAAAYGQQQAAFAAAYRQAIEPSTRGLMTVRRKDDARKAITATTRELGRVIRAQPGVTGVTVVQLLSLGLRGAGGKPVGAETGEADAAARAPWVTVSAPGRRVTVRLRGDADRRARPSGAVGAAVYWYAGEEYPETMRGWQLAGNTTRPELSFTLPLGVEPGTKVWVCAAWLDRRLRPGRLSMPRETRLGYGFVLAA